MSADALAAEASTPTTREEGDGEPHPWRWRYENGVWAMPLALAPAFLFAAARGVPTPLEPLSEAIMLLTPVNLATTLLSALGGFAPTVGLLGAIAVCLPIGGLLGLGAPGPGARGRAGLWWPRWALVAILALLLALPLAFAATSPDAAGSALLAALAFPGALALVRAARCRVGGHDSEDDALSVAASVPPRRAGLTRRMLLGRLSGTTFTVGAALVLGTYDYWSGPVAGLFGRDLVSRVLFAFAPPRPRQPGFPVPGEVPEVTPNADFYLISKDQVPPLILPSDWSVRVSGAVARPLTLGYDQLLALPRVDEYVTLRCVDNPPAGKLMSTAYWSGVPLAALLAQVGIDSGVDPASAGLVLRAPADAYEEVVPLAFALGPVALLAYGMNGVSLPRAHGGPVRALVPGYFGFKNVKWLAGLEVLPMMPKGYWASLGWTAAKVHPIARIDTWQATTEGLRVGGVAFAGTAGISAVELRVDGGAWQPASLNTPALSGMTWVQWRAVLTLTPGTHTLTARMIDGAGVPQDARAQGVYPGGATGLMSVQVTI